MVQAYRDRNTLKEIREVWDHMKMDTNQVNNRATVKMSLTQYTHSQVRHDLPTSLRIVD